MTTFHKNCVQSSTKQQKMQQHISEPWGRDVSWQRRILQRHFALFQYCLLSTKCSAFVGGVSIIMINVQRWVVVQAVRFLSVLVQHYNGQPHKLDIQYISHVLDDFIILNNAYDSCKAQLQQFLHMRSNSYTLGTRPWQRKKIFYPHRCSQFWVMSQIQ